MSDADLLEFMKIQKWNEAEKKTLVLEWNKRRPSSPIGVNHIRTPCRLKQIRGSLIRFIETEKKVSL